MKIFANPLFYGCEAVSVTVENVAEAAGDIGFENIERSVCVYRQDAIIVFGFFRIDLAVNSTLCIA